MKRRKDQKKLPPHTIYKRPTIGLFVENTSDMGQGYYPCILDGVMATVQKHDANLLCFIGGSFYGVPDIPFDAQRNILYDIASEDCLDGLILISSIGNYAPQEEVKNLYTRYKPLPTVTLGTAIEGTTNVTVDHRAGMYEMLVHLIEVHQYRRIAFIRGPVDSPDAEVRYQVYREVLAQYNIPFDPQLVVSGMFRFISGANAVRTLLDERKVDFEVIVGANDHMALGALGELQARGCVVPYEMAVAGFDNIKQAKNIVPPLTTVRQPLSQLGEVSVNLLMAKIAREAVPEQVILSTELMVRRSCGCLQTQIPAIDSASLQRAGLYNSVAECLTACHEVIVSDLVREVDFSVLDGREGAARLLNGLADEVVRGENGRFLATIDQLLRAVITAGGEIASWQTMVAVLRRHLISSREQDKLSLRTGSLLYEAQVFITSEIRNVEAQRRLQIDRRNGLLHDIGQLLITMLDVDGLMETIAESMPRLGIPACYLVLYEDPQPYRFSQLPPARSQLVLAYNENGRIPLHPDKTRFPTRNLIPDGILPQHRSFTMMVEPLYFREEQIGYILLERGPRDGDVYELLRGQIASALKGALLLQAHKEAEAEVRIHRDHLDELVQEHTVALASANKKLWQEIEERRQTEARLQQSQKNLAYAQKIARLGYSNWVIGTDDFVWSDEMYRIFGVKKGEFVLSRETLRTLIHPDDLKLFIAVTSQPGQNKEIHQFEFRTINQEDGRVKHVYLWGELTYAEDGHPVSIFNIFQDITVRRQAELKLEAYTAELERSNQELQEFAYVASHDLQEPLRKIQAFGDRLQQKYYTELDERGQSYIDRMQNAAARMQALIVALLAFSRVRTHTQPFTRVDLSQVVKNVLQDLENNIVVAEATIKVSDLPVVEADALQMHQLFQNLLGNALKFRHPERSLHIEIDHRLVDPFCELTIADNGIGFAQENAERIFDVFERLQNRDDYPGTGVGLAICRRIVERHGGDIQAQGEPGKGAWFTVRLLIRQPADKY